MRKNAVENFLASLDTKESIEVHRLNLLRDKAVYHWDQETVCEIWRGINQKYERNHHGNNTTKKS